MTNTTGRPPTEGTRLSNPQHVRFEQDVLRVAQRIANQKFGGNISRGLRYLAKLGALAVKSQE